MTILTETSANNSPTAMIGVRGLNQHVGEYSVSADVNFGLPLSAKWTSETIMTAQRDFEIIAAKLKDHPNEVADMMDALAAGNMKEGVETLKKIGLTESDLKAAGGGLPWVAIAVGVAIFLYATDAW
jgi:hypothetical protein